VRKLPGKIAAVATRAAAVVGDGLSALVRPAAAKPAAGAGLKEGRVGDVEDPERIIRQGLLVTLLFFGSLGLWAVFGHINGAVVAPGRIKIESERKTVQHLEGGIVEAILVREGENVREGAPLIVLESVQVDAAAGMLQKQLVAQTAAHLRAEAEKNLRNELVWPEDLLDMAVRAHCEDVPDNELKNFHARGEALRGQISLLESQSAQVDAQIAGYEDQIQAEDRIIATLHEELAAKRQLHRERYLEKSHILELERILADHTGKRGSLRQAVAEARQRNAELLLRIADAKNRFVEQAAAEAGRLQNEIIQTSERIRPLADAGKRLQVTAPVAGKVVDLKVHSKGGVVRPGEPLMDIVPDDTPLVVETRVPVNKITEVAVGRDALVQLDAFDTRLVPHMAAKVSYVSADRLEERTGMGEVPYYLCYVEINPDDLEKERLYLSPGMPATVFITTGERTILYYMFEPLIKNWERALRD
jgi:HlyD family secretion protein/epimerase transport system membrane fusion protein